MHRQPSANKQGEAQEERVLELIADATTEYNTAANGNDFEAGRFWGPLRSCLRELLTARATIASQAAEIARLMQERESMALANRDYIVATKATIDALAQQVEQLQVRLNCGFAGDGPTYSCLLCGQIGTDHPVLLRRALTVARDELVRYIDFMHKSDYREYAAPVEQKLAAINEVLSHV